MAHPLPEKQPAHRPSRRHLIIEAAVRVFARQGFVDTSVQDVAEEAQVVPNAIYYHVAGKEELFDAALRHAMELVDEAVDAARNAGPDKGADTLRAVVDVVWTWLEEHPDHGQLLYSHLPGATPRARALWEEFEDRHVRQALDYLEEVRGPRSGYSAAANKAAQMFTGRTLISLLMVMHPLRMEGGPLAGHAPRGLRNAVNEVATALISADPPVPVPSSPAALPPHRRVGRSGPGRRTLGGQRKHVAVARVPQDVETHRGDAPLVTNADETVGVVATESENVVPLIIAEHVLGPDVGAALGGGQAVGIRLEGAGVHVRQEVLGGL